MTTDGQVLTVDLGFPESIRWHHERIWLCNWGAGEVLALSADGEREVRLRLPPETLPFSIDWLPDGRLLVIDGTRRLLLVQEPDGSLATVADLSGCSSAPFNELVVDSAGNAYVNGGTGSIVLVAGASIREVASGLKWPNGMALIDEGRTLVIADSHDEQLLAYDVGNDGSLSQRRVWAELENAPDGICADADGAIWVASVPGQHCIRVREGGSVLGEVTVDRGCFACMLGGADGRTLFVAAAQWRGMEAAMRDGPGSTGRVIAFAGAPAPHAGRP